MGGSKRMSLEEKRKVILDIYHQSKQVYTEKEITTLASKAGVNTNTIVDINTSLVDDGLVDKEKIGGSNYFWSFPSKKDRLMQMKYEKVCKDIDMMKQKVEETKIRLADAKRGREEDEEEEEQEDGKQEEGEKQDGANQEEEGGEATTANPSPKKKMKLTRSNKLQKLEQIRNEKKKILEELETLKENDPLAIANLAKELKLITEAANRWTDNIFNCKSYLTKKRNLDNKEAMRILGITSAFDYPEETS